MIGDAALREMHLPQTVVPVERWYANLGPVNHQMVPGTHFFTYGMGWFLQNYRGQYVVQHGGQAGGMRALVAMIPELNLGVCLDTAHAFTAGYDLRDEDGFFATFDALERNVGTQNVRAVHFNDSRAAYNSRVDRHWHIGLGHIGAEALARVARHPSLAHAAFLLETPQDEVGDDERNLAALRSYLAPRAAHGEEEEVCLTTSS